MTLTESEVRDHLATTLTRPYRHQPGDELYGVAKISRDGTYLTGKLFHPDARADADEYYNKHETHDSELYNYDPENEFLVLYEATVAYVKRPVSPRAEETEMGLENISFEKYDPPTTPSS